VRVAQLVDLISNKICASRAGTVDIIKRFSGSAGSGRREVSELTTNHHIRWPHHIAELPGPRISSRISFALSSFLATHPTTSPLKTRAVPERGGVKPHTQGDRVLDAEWRVETAHSMAGLVENIALLEAGIRAAAPALTSLANRKRRCRPARGYCAAEVRGSNPPAPPGSPA
jgi:hypothetical protein